MLLPIYVFLTISLHVYSQSITKRRESDQILLRFLPMGKKAWYIYQFVYLHCIKLVSCISKYIIQR